MLQLVYPRPVGNWGFETNHTIQQAQKGTMSSQVRIFILCGLLGKQSKRIYVQWWLKPYLGIKPKLHHGRLLQPKLNVHLLVQVMIYPKDQFSSVIICSTYTLGVSQERNTASFGYSKGLWVRLILPEFPPHAAVCHCPHQLFSTGWWRGWLYLSGDI